MACAVVQQPVCDASKDGLRLGGCQKLGTRVRLSKVGHGYDLQGVVVCTIVCNKMASGAMQCDPCPGVERFDQRCLVSS